MPQSDIAKYHLGHGLERASPKYVDMTFLHHGHPSLGQMPSAQQTQLDLFGIWLGKALATCRNWLLSVCDVHLPLCGAGMGSDPSFPDLTSDLGTSLHPFFHPCHPPGCSPSPAPSHPSASSSFSLSHPHSLHLQQPPECPFSRDDPSSACHPQLSFPQLHNTL